MPVRVNETPRKGGVCFSGIMAGRKGCRSHERGKRVVKYREPQAARRGSSMRNIAFSCSCSKTTVKNVVVTAIGRNEDG